MLGAGINQAENLSLPSHPMSHSPRTLLCSIALVVGFATAPARAAATPVWSFTVSAPSAAPAPATTSSELSSITSDSVGDTLIIVIDKNNGTTVATQLFLLTPKGTKIWGAELPISSVSVDPVLVSAKRVVVSIGGSLLELFLDKVTKEVVGLPIDTESPNHDEGVVQPTPANFTSKYVHTTIATGNYVTTVKRYLITKLP